MSLTHFVRKIVTVGKRGNSVFGMRGFILSVIVKIRGDVKIDLLSGDLSSLELYIMGLL